MLLLSGAQCFAATDAPCRAIVDRLRSLKPDFSGFILPELARHRNRVLDIERDVPGDQEEDANGILREFPPSPELRAQLDAIPSDRFWRLKRAGKTGVYAVETIGGTAACQRFTFFETVRAKGSRLIRSPPTLHDESALCFNATGRLAVINGKPAFMTEVDLDRFRPGSSTEIEAWSRDGDGWTQSCRADLRFMPEFAVGESFCTDDDCGWAQKIALTLTAQYDANPTAPPRVLNLPNASSTGELETLRRLAEEEGRNVPVPSFGKNPRTSYRDFGPAYALVDAVIAGRPYLIRLGHGTLGWRQSADYLVAFYTLASDDSLAPAAGLVIAKTRGPLVQAKIIARPERP